MQTLRVCVRSGLRPDTSNRFRGRENIEKTAVAIYHLSVKTISRSAGRSATAAAAYRSGVKIEDEATGEIHDYTRKGGVESATLVLPSDAPKWASDRAQLWNKAEAAETRKNSTVAREFEIALPEELTPDQRQKLAVEFARQLVQRHQCAADVAIHAPGKEGDTRNHHAHILLTTRRLTPEGFTEKTRELDDKKQGSELVKEWRGRFALLQNAYLRDAGHSAQVDHRSLEAQGLDREPTVHLGPAATAIERRTGQPSKVRQDHIKQILEKAGINEDLGRSNVRIADLEQMLTDAKEEKAQQAAKAEPRLEDLSPQHQVAVWDATVEKGVRGVQKRIDKTSNKAYARCARRDDKLRALQREKPMAPTGFFGVFKEKAYQADLHAWSNKAAKAEKLADQADRLLDRLHERYKQAQVTVYAKLKEKFPEWAANVARYKPMLRAERFKEEEAQRQEKREKSRGRDRGMSR